MTSEEYQAFQKLEQLYDIVNEEYKRALDIAIKKLNGEEYSQELYSGCFKCKEYKHCADAFYNNAVNCYGYGKDEND